MKKTATRLLAGMLALVLAMLAVPNVVGMEKVQAANDGKVSITSIVAEENDGKIGTSFQYRISLQAPDVEFAYMQADVKIGNGYVCGSSVLYDETSDTYLVPVQKEYYGTYQIADLYFQDANGKTYIFYNDHYQGLYNVPTTEGVAVDMSSADLVLTPTSGKADTQKPTLATDAVSCAQKEVAFGDPIIWYFKPQDNEGIARVDVEYAVNGDSVCQAQAIYDATKDCYVLKTGDVFDKKYGTYEIAKITVTDTSYNQLEIINSDYSNSGNIFVGQGAVKEALGAYNVTVKNASGIVDTEAPIIDTSSIQVSAKNIERKDRVTLSLKITDASEISSVHLYLKRGKGGICGMGGMMYNAATGCYETELWETTYYGKWELQMINVQDVFGNTACYVNTAYSAYRADSLEWFPDAWEIKKADLSSADFSVGLEDKDSGVYVTGDGMDDDMTLDVTEMDWFSRIFWLLHKNLLNEVNSFFDVVVGGGGFTGSVDIKIPVKGAKDGDKVIVRHLKHDGSIQEDEAYVVDGYAVMTVTEFSPFMVETVTGDSGSGTGDATPSGQPTDTLDPSGQGSTQANTALNTAGQTNTATTSPATGEQMAAGFGIVMILCVAAVGVFYIGSRRKKSCE